MQIHIRKEKVEKKRKKKKFVVIIGAHVVWVLRMYEYVTPQKTNENNREEIRNDEYEEKETKVKKMTDIIKSRKGT